MKTIDDAEVPKACLDAACEYGRHSDVVAVALGGSRSTGLADPTSDFDLYVYTRSELDLGARAKIARANSTRAEVGNRIWEPGDEWHDQSGIHLDVMFRSTRWIEDQLARVLDRHEASVGYSTCFWGNVLYSRIVFDRDGWFARLQELARAPYPDGLRSGIILKNWPILSSTFSSYRHQLERAVDRGDLVSVQHRVSAALASYFDILFALNRQPHPGEKRLMYWVETRCAVKPARWREQVVDLLSASCGGPMVISAFDAMMNDLDAVLAAEGFSVPAVHDRSPLAVNQPATSVAHTALWTADLERSRAFYERYFGARAGALYQSKRRIFSSYFLHFPSGGRVELMQAPKEPERGWAHLALSIGSRQRVDDLTARLAADGVRVRSGPRQTGDGYYESVVEDPDGNELEVTV